MAFSPVTLHKRGQIAVADTREEELRLRWEGWSSDPDGLPARDEVVLAPLTTIEDILSAVRGQANGVAPLGADSRIPAVYMPNDASSGSLEAHVLSELPHPVYDEMLDLTVILENGMV